MAKIITLPDVDTAVNTWYQESASDKNNFSFWFEKVKNCGIAVPESIVIPVPQDVLQCFFLERENDEQMIHDWVAREVFPKVKFSLLFVKNGAFSNKFNFKACAPEHNCSALTASIINIQYWSLCYETGGETEIVIRERVGWQNEGKCCRIYSGMPLRPEFRIFYDFDNHKALYTANYWDWNYCHDQIAKDKTDGYVYELVYPELYDFYENHKQEAKQLVSDHMKNVTGLSGIWSVDLMWADDQFYLIDMAIGSRSAYYDPEKIAAAQKEVKWEI